MISILRPSTPPLALISSAASCAACGIEAPAIACASAITPILIGSAANALLDAMAKRPTVATPRSRPRSEQTTREHGFLFIGFVSSTMCAPCNVLIFYVGVQSSQARPRPTKVEEAPQCSTAELQFAGLVAEQHGTLNNVPCGF